MAKKRFEYKKGGAHHYKIDTHKEQAVQVLAYTFGPATETLAINYVELSTAYQLGDVKSSKTEFAAAIRLAQSLLNDIIKREL